MFCEQQTKMNIEKKEIIEQTFLHLKEKLGEKLDWPQPYSEELDKEYDAVFTISGKAIYVVVKKEIRSNQIEQLLRLKKEVENIIILANYITPNAKKQMREKMLNYTDRAGNTWFQFESVYIHIEGIANPTPSPTQDIKNRAFTKTGIKVVFQFLNQPELLNVTYRQIVAATGVSLGTIPKVMAGLQIEGLLLKKNQTEWIVDDYKKLLNRWQVAYTRKLKPTLFIKRYRSTDGDFRANWKKLALQGEDRWGSEPAGNLLTNHIRPAVFTLYTDQTQREIMKNYRWIPDQKGEIYVFKRFWKTYETSLPKNCVPAVLVYADLMETGDSRCLETAHIIYEQYLQKL